MSVEDQYIKIEFENIYGSSMYTDTTKIKLSRLETNEPQLDMNGLTFVGRYEYEIGTDVIIPHNDDEPLALCRKKIVFKPLVQPPDYKALYEKNQECYRKKIFGYDEQMEQVDLNEENKEK
ncbi:hypothetical protein WA158_001652 [Blastocystis sp. Blastoise]